MQTFSEISELGQLEGRLHLAIGVFDGVHRGHQAVIQSAIQKAASEGPSTHAVVVTFDPHPIRVIAPDKAPRLLTSALHQHVILERLGVSHVLVIPFDHAFSQWSGEQFVTRLVDASDRLAGIHVGEGWCFGHHRSGTTTLLREWGAKCDFTVHAIPSVEWQGEIVSSTMIRAAVRAGDLRRASDLLQREYSVYGEVISGQQLGRTIGFPTANLRVFNEQLPPGGVYAVKVLYGSRQIRGVANLGTRPTVASDQAERRLEVHLFDFAEPLYGEFLEIEFLAFLREEKKFEDLGALKTQIATDVLAAKAHLPVTP